MVAILKRELLCVVMPALAIAKTNFSLLTIISASPFVPFGIILFIIFPNRTIVDSFQKIIVPFGSDLWYNGFGGGRIDTRRKNKRHSKKSAFDTRGFGAESEFVGYEHTPL